MGVFVSLIARFLCMQAAVRTVQTVLVLKDTYGLHCANSAF